MGWAYKRVVGHDEYERQLDADRRASRAKEYFSARPWWVAKDLWDGGFSLPKPEISASPKIEVKKPLQLYLVSVEHIVRIRTTEFLVLAETHDEARNAVQTGYGLIATQCVEVEGPFRNGTVLMLRHNV